MIKNNDNYPLVSILVPVYGEEDCLPLCIKSLVNQEYPNIEIVLVDDGSPDNCPQICDEWSLKDNRIKVIHKKNGGLVSARKEGIINASGEYIAYVDGDDWIDSDFISLMMQNILKYNADVVTCGYKKELSKCSVLSTNGIACGFYDRELLEKNVFPNMIFDKRTSIGSVCTYLWNKIFKKELVVKSQLDVDNNIVIGEDSICVYPTLLKSNKIVSINYNGYHYRQRNGSLLRNTSISTKALDKLKLFYFEFNNFIKTINDKWNLKEQLDNYYVTQLIMMSDVLFYKYDHLNEAFPFFNLSKGKDIIIYSAGAFGIHLFNLYNHNKYCNVVAWTDPDYASYETSLHIPVVSLSEAVKNHFDKIIIASVNTEFIEKCKKFITEQGIDECKVIEIGSNLQKIFNELKKVGVFNE